MNEHNNTNLSEEIRKKIRRRYNLVFYVFFIFIFIIFIQVGKVQFVEGKAWRALEKQQKKENVEVAPNRGNIYSRDGQLMASTVPSYSLYMDFQAVNPDTLFEYINPLCEKLSQKIGDKSSSEYRKHLMKGYKKKSREYLISSKRVTHSDLRAIQKFPLFCKGRYQSGLYEKKYFKREKPFGSLASRTIGDIYGEFSKGGKNGLEMYYDSLLRGSHGLSIRQKVAGKYISVTTQPPVDGTDLVTTLDLNIQDIAESALVNKLAEINATSGSVVVMEVSTGEILAISNMAVRDSGVYAESQNFAMSDQSEPGSTFKTLAMMVALEDKVVDPKDSFDTGNGVRMMYGSKMTDHNAHRGGYHTITAEQSIWYSSNVGISHFIDSHYRNNPSKFVDGLYRMGFNKAMQLEIPGSGKPYIPHPKSEKRYWAKTDLPWMSIGYVTKIPPIYTLAYYNAIANKGVFVKPHFVKELRKNGQTVKKFEAEVINQKICSDETLSKIHNMLDSVVRSVKGTGKPVNSPYVNIAGKTGTAQISKGAMGYKEGGKSHQVSFCGFYPSEAPKYSCIVVVREPKKGIASGGVMAGGVFREIAERIYSREKRLYADSLPADSIKGLYPIFKSGNTDLTKVIIKDFGINASINPAIESDWIDINTKNNKIAAVPRNFTSRLIPDVKNMGARDAVYILGNLGLKVSLKGKGKVVSQSINPGSLYNKGQSITLLLE